MFVRIEKNKKQNWKSNRVDIFKISSKKLSEIETRRERRILTHFLQYFVLTRVSLARRAGRIFPLFIVIFLFCRQMCRGMIYGSLVLRNVNYNTTLDWSRENFLSLVYTFTVKPV